MKKNLSLLAFIFALTISYAVFGQQQIENPGFEFWEEYGFGTDTLEPVNWNSLKSSDGCDFINTVIPVTLERSTDAHTGTYSVKLYNAAVLTTVASGIVTNGRVHAEMSGTGWAFTDTGNDAWRTPFTQKPDSVVIWAKYTPVGGDVAQV